MGTDIHFYVEKRVNGAWVTCDTWKKEDGYTDVDYKVQFFGDRNYDLFAILADVRNGHGFAGVKTGEGFVPISAPKGWPEDCCPELRALFDRGIEHTPSYLTVKEIMDYDWTQTTKKQGWVDLSGWAQWKIKGSPDNYSGGIDGGLVVKVSQKQVQEAWDKISLGREPYALYHAEKETVEKVCSLLGVERDTLNVYTLVTWEIPYYDAGRNFLSQTLPRLWRLGAPEDVRCVFFFDS